MINVKHKSAFAILLIILLSLTFSIDVFADEVKKVTTSDKVETKKSTTNEDIYGKYAPSSAINDDITPNVTIDQVSKWGEKKGFDIVRLLQKIVQPFAIIIFIISAFMTMGGVVGNGQLVGKGVFGMAICLIVYATVLYAPEIHDIFLAWIGS